MNIFVKRKVVIECAILFMISAIFVVLVRLLTSPATSPATTPAVVAPSHNFSKFGKDSPRDFNSFLKSCTDIERIQMLQALWDFSSKYNTMKPGGVMSAVRTGQLDVSSISCEAVRKSSRMAFVQ